MCELDFTTSIENVTQPNGISAVRHIGEWEYIRHPSFILQFHEVDDNKRPQFQNNSGADTDMGEMRHKFEFRLNKDLGYEWILWRDTNNTWQSFQVDTIGDKKEIIIEANTALENRFLVFSTSSNPNNSEAVAWFYPESSFNANGTLQKSRVNKNITSSDDRRTSIRIVADWRKSNWCRMNLYVRNEGLMAPCNGNPNIYEAFQMEAIQLFGTPNEILNEVINYNPIVSIKQVEYDYPPSVFPNPFSSELIIKGENIVNQKIKLYSILGEDISSAIETIAHSNNELIIRANALHAGVYILQIGATTTKIYKE